MIGVWRGKKEIEAEHDSQCFSWRHPGTSVRLESYLPTDVCEDGVRKPGIVYMDFCRFAKKSKKSKKSRMFGWKCIDLIVGIHD